MEISGTLNMLRKEEDLGPHIPAPETRTNLCSFATKDSCRLGKNQQNESPKALASSKTAAPLCKVAGGKNEKSGICCAGPST